MIERRKHARLALEPRQTVRIGDESGGQDLDRDITPEARVVCAINLAHPADAQQAGDLERTETAAESEGHGVEERGDSTAKWPLLRSALEVRRRFVAGSIPNTWGTIHSDGESRRRRGHQWTRSEVAVRVSVPLATAGSRPPYPPFARGGTRRKACSSCRNL